MSLAIDNLDRPKFWDILVRQPVNQIGRDIEKKEKKSCECGGEKSHCETCLSQIVNKRKRFRVDENSENADELDQSTSPGRFSVDSAGYSFNSEESFF